MTKVAPITEQSDTGVALLALGSGLPPHAERMECDDLRGSCSLFGESVVMPKPIACRSLLASKDTQEDSGALRVLWESREEKSCLARATDISFLSRNGAHGGDRGPTRHCRLDVPATVYICGACTSTFSVAWSLCRDGLLPAWGAVIASRQTQGRGQMRRPWHSPRGNLYVTFRLPYDPLLRGDCSSLLLGWLLVSAFRNLGFLLSLKWPNDLLLNEQAKVGGVLLEEREGILMAGLGVNLLEAPGMSEMRGPDCPPATVLLPSCGERLQGTCTNNNDADEEGEEPLAPFPLWRLLVSELILEYSRSVFGHRLEHILHKVDDCLAWKGKKVTVREEGKYMASGLFMGLGPFGGMLIGLGRGGRRELFSGSLFYGD